MKNINKIRILNTITTLVALAAALGHTELRAGDKTNMVWIQPGEFMMGSPTNEAQRTLSSLETQHKVTITSGFYIGKYEVTQKEYISIIGKNPSYHAFGNYNLPVENLSWKDATNYCNLLTQKELSAKNIPAGWAYRLPTEAEWEYACRAGTTTAFSFGDTITANDANFDWHRLYNSEVGTIWVELLQKPSAGMPVSVGSYAPNPWGLYDMEGNVGEWCQDLYDSYKVGSAIDPNGTNGVYHVVRGSQFPCPGLELRSAARGDCYSPNSAIGFRVVLAPQIADWKKAITTPKPQPKYGNYPLKGSGKNNLVIITHGWQPWMLPIDVSFVDKMSNAVTGYLKNHSLDDWQVYGYKWSDKAHTIFPSDALNNAEQEGRNLGNCIATQKWNHVHLIAHSAGAGLIQAVLEKIKTLSQNTSVHTTFLDPFVGLDYSGTDKYGKGADWADNYCARDTETGGEILPFTYNILRYAYNVEVTYLDAEHRVLRPYFVSGSGGPCYTTTSSHGWPINFYLNTIKGTVEPGYAAFGFPLGKEGENWKKSLSDYKPGNGIPLNPNSVKVLGAPDATDCRVELKLPVKKSSAKDFLARPVIQSSSASTQKLPDGSIVQKASSSSWFSSSIVVADSANTVSFDVAFQSVPGSQGLLSVYWDTNIICLIDERIVPDGFSHYSCRFPDAANNSVHMLGFRLDQFSANESVVVITNVVTGFAGMSQSFSLMMTTNKVGGKSVYQLKGEPGFEYHIHSSENLADWTDILTLANVTGIVEFFDQNNAENNRRFYRAVVPY